MNTAKFEKELKHKRF